MNGLDVLGAPPSLTARIPESRASLSAQPDAVAFRGAAERAAFAIFVAAALAGILVRVGYLATESAWARAESSAARAADAAVLQMRNRGKTLAPEFSEAWVSAAAGAMAGSFAQEKWPDDSVVLRVVETAARAADGIVRQTQVRART